MPFIKSLFSVTLVFIMCSQALSQSREGLIKLELKNYETKASLGQVVGEGETIEGQPHGFWEYYLVYDRNIKYYSGHYDHGKKTGVWNNYALQPPMGYSNNYDLKRSSETWRDGKLYRFKMGQDNLLLTLSIGITDAQAMELKRLDEAFENSYRRTHGKTVTPEFGESVESIQARLIPMIRQEVINLNQPAELKQWSLYNKLRLHETYDSGKVISSIVQSWEKDVLFSKEVYENETLREKIIYMDGDPSNFIEYHYTPEGELRYLHHYIRDTVPHGRWIENYADGAKKFQGSYNMGVRDGKWKFWDEEGQLEVIKFKDGVPK